MRNVELNVIACCCLRADVGNWVLNRDSERRGGAGCWCCVRGGGAAGRRGGLRGDPPAAGSAQATWGARCAWGATRASEGTPGTAAPHPQAQPPPNPSGANFVNIINLPINLLFLS